MTAHAIALIMALAAAGQPPTAETWATFTPPGGGFTVQAPGTRKPDPGNSLKFSFVTEDSAFIVEVDPCAFAIDRGRVPLGRKGRP